MARCLHTASYMNNDNPLISAIIDGIQEKKGQGITLIDLTSLDGSVCDAFVICEGRSPQQVEAISDSVFDVVLEQVHEKPIHTIGAENAQWIAMDYSNVMVHIMLPDMRHFYSIESLWEDAPATHIADV